MELKAKRIVRLFAAIMTLSLALSPVHAATSGFIDVFVDKAAGSCKDSVLVIESSWTFTNNDANGEDLVGIMAFDAAGNTLAADWQGSYQDQTFVRLTAFGGEYGGGDLQYRPITIDLYDLSRRPAEGQNTAVVANSILGQSPPLLERFIYDPAADIASCDLIPLMTNVQARNALFSGRQLALGIPMMALLVLVPIRQVQRTQFKQEQS